jgi:hypothetical protein
MPNGQNLQDIFSDSDFLSLSPAGRRATIRQLVPELRTATDTQIDTFATAYGGKSYQQMTDTASLPGNMQSKPGGPVTNTYGITGPFAPKPGETPQDAFMRAIRERAGMGEQINELGNKVIVPQENESFASTIDRAVQYGKTVTPQQIQQETRSAARKAPLALAAGPVMAAAQLAVPIAAGAALAPTAGTATVGTGILDAGGTEIMKDVATQGPSLARAGVNLAINAIKAHPYISGAIALRLSKTLGLPVEKIAKALLGMETAQ